MAYTDPGDIAGGAVVTKTYLDNIRASILASAPAVAAAEGDLIIATAANVVAALTVGAADSTLVAGADRPEWQIQPAVHLTKSGTTGMGTSSWTALDFDTETSDTNALHSTSTNPSRITIPTSGDGWYTIGFYGNASRSGATGTWRARVLLNGTSVLVQGQASDASGVQSHIPVMCVYPLAATNYIEAQYYTADGSMTMAAGPSFYAIWQRRP